MGLFNVFIVIPQLLVATVMGSILKTFFPDRTDLDDGVRGRGNGTSCIGYAAGEGGSCELIMVSPAGFEPATY